MIEGPSNIYTSLFLTNNFSMLSLAVLCGGFLSFGMVLIELALVSHTSVLTLSVSGIFKELVTISTSMFIFNDKLNPMTVVGLVISLVGIIAYNQIRRSAAHIKPEEVELMQVDTEYSEVQSTLEVDADE
jgi:solute carrier family 35, member C2